MTGQDPNTCKPMQGDIFLCRALKQQGDGKNRPVVVISENVRNANGRTVLVVPVTSNTAACRGNPARVFVSSGEGGLTCDSYVSCDLITTVKIGELLKGPFGSISEKTLVLIQKAIMVAIGNYSS